jgi:DNA-binding XRE family transcriptional regulator
MKHDCGTLSVRSTFGRQRSPATRRGASFKIGMRVQALRLAKGWTQRDLARRASIPVGTVSSIEMGRYEEVGSLQLKALKNALSCTADFLLGE